MPPMAREDIDTVPPDGWNNRGHCTACTFAWWLYLKIPIIIIKLTACWCSSTPHSIGLTGTCRRATQCVASGTGVGSCPISTNGHSSIERREEGGAWSYCEHREYPSQLFVYGRFHTHRKLEQLQSMSQIGRGVHWSPFWWSRSYRCR